MTRYTASPARAAAALLGLTALLGLSAAGCDARDEDRVACARRCGALGGYVKDLETRGSPTATGCICMFPMPFTDAGAR